MIYFQLTNYLLFVRHQQYYTTSDNYDWRWIKTLSYSYYVHRVIDILFVPTHEKYLITIEKIYLLISFFEIFIPYSTLNYTYNILINALKIEQIT